MIPINVIPIVERMLIRDRTLNVVSRIVAIDNVAQQGWLIRVPRVAGIVLRSDGGRMCRWWRLKQLSRQMHPVEIPEPDVMLP